MQLFGSALFFYFNKQRGLPRCPLELHPADIAIERVRHCHDIVGQRRRLRLLRMRVPDHDRARMLLRE